MREYDGSHYTRSTEGLLKRGEGVVMEGEVGSFGDNIFKQGFWARLSDTDDVGPMNTAEGSWRVELQEQWRGVWGSSERPAGG